MRVLICALLTCVFIAGSVVYAQETEQDAPWRQRFNANVSGSSGNTRKTDMTAGWVARQQKLRYRRRLDASYHLGTTGSEVDQSAFTSGAVKDWLLGDSTWDENAFFAFGQGRYDFDNFRSWRHRASTHWGLGRMLINTGEPRHGERLELLGRAGVGASKQWERTEDIKPEGLLGAELTWDISDTHLFAASSYMYPELDNLSKFRLISKAELNIAIDYARGMSFVSGIEHDYESSAGTEARNWDVRYYAGIAINF